MSKNVYLLSILSCVLLISTLACTEKDSPYEGTIMVYSTFQPEQFDEYIANFEEKFPDISVERKLGTTSAIHNFLINEKISPEADVIWGFTATDILHLEWLDLLKPYDYHIFDELQNKIGDHALERIQPQFRDSNYPPYWVGIAIWVAALCINTFAMDNLGLEIPKNWDDLTEKVYEGCITMPHPQKTGSGYFMVSTILQMSDNPMSGWQYLGRLDEQVVDYTETEAKSCQLVSNRTYPLGLSFAYQGDIERRQGKAVETIFFEQNVPWDLYTVALVKKKEIKPAAQTFLSWAISNEGMKQYVKHLPVTLDQSQAEGFSVIPANYPDDLIDRRLFAEQDFPWASANFDTIVDQWVRSYDRQSQNTSVNASEALLRQCGLGIFYED